MWVCVLLWIHTHNLYMDGAWHTYAYLQVHSDVYAGLPFSHSHCSFRDRGPHSAFYFTCHVPLKKGYGIHTFRAVWISFSIALGLGNVPLDGSWALVSNWPEEAHTPRQGDKSLCDLLWKTQDLYMVGLHWPHWLELPAEQTPGAASFIPKWSSYIALTPEATRLPSLVGGALGSARGRGQSGMGPSLFFPSFFCYGCNL